MALGIWEFWGAYSSARELMDFYDSLPAAYAQPGILNPKPPKVIVSLSAKGVPGEAAFNIQGQIAVSGVTAQTFTLSSGATVTGVPVSFSAEPIEHSPLFHLHLSVRIDGVSEITWHYWGAFSSAMELIEFYGGAPGTFSPYTLIQGKPPKNTVQLSARGVALGDALAVQAAMNTPGTASFSTGDNQTAKGFVTNFSASPIEHTGLYEVRISVRTDGESTVLFQYYGTKNADKTLEEFYAAPNGGYGAVTFYDQRLPKKVEAVMAEGVDSDTANGYYTDIDTPGFSVSLAMADNSTVAGRLVGVSLDPVKYTTLYNLHLAVRVQ